MSRTSQQGCFHFVHVKWVARQIDDIDLHDAWRTALLTSRTARAVRCRTSGWPVAVGSEHSLLVVGSEARTAKEGNEEHYLTKRRSVYFPFSFRSIGLAGRKLLKRRRVCGGRAHARTPFQRPMVLLLIGNHAEMCVGSKVVCIAQKMLRANSKGSSLPQGINMFQSARSRRRRRAAAATPQHSALGTRQGVSARARQRWLA